MIVVKIELISAIDPSRDRELGRMYIANTGESRDPKRSDYTVAVCRRGSDKIPRPFDSSGPAPTRTGTVLAYPRLAYNVWRLVARAVLSAFPEEKSDKARSSVPHGIGESEEAEPE